MNKIMICMMVSVFIISISCKFVFAFDGLDSFDSKDITETFFKIDMQKNKKEIVEELESLAEDFEKKGFYNRALDVYNKILQQKIPKKKRFECYVRIGDLYRLKKDYSYSLDFYRQALYLRKKDTNLMIKIGYIFLEGNLFNLAETTFLDILKIYKHSNAANRGLGDVYYKQSIYAKAINYYSKIPNELYDKEIVKNMADCYRNLDKIHEGAEVLEAYLKKNEDSDLLFELGIIYMDKKEYQKAKEIFLKSLKLNYMNFKSYVYLGSLYDLTGESRKAKKMFKKAYNIDSSYAAIDFMRAKVAYKLGMLDEARTYAKDAYNKAKTIFIKNQSKKLIDFLNNK